MSTPILNPPQSGILGMHKLARRPIAVGDKVEIRPMMYVALSYDHRIVDGREAVTFLVRIKECVEEPSRILFDVSISRNRTGMPSSPGLCRSNSVMLEITRKKVG
jgi:2-oxoglutarate dehydrogenase E2 component (dihydrolipoamide succinyltransferase)